MDFGRAMKTALCGCKVSFEDWTGGSYAYSKEGKIFIYDGIEKKHRPLVLHTKWINGEWSVVQKEIKTLSDEMHTIDISPVRTLFDGEEVKHMRSLIDWIDSSNVKEKIDDIKADFLKMAIPGMALFESKIPNIKEDLKRHINKIFDKHLGDKLC